MKRTVLIFHTFLRESMCPVLGFFLACGVSRVQIIFSHSTYFIQMSCWINFMTFQKKNKKKIKRYNFENCFSLKSPFVLWLNFDISLPGRSGLLPHRRRMTTTFTSTRRCCWCTTPRRCRSPSCLPFTSARSTSASRQTRRVGHSFWGRLRMNWKSLWTRREAKCLMLMHVVDEAFKRHKGTVPK